MANNLMLCPLCGSSNGGGYYADAQRAYWHCKSCDLVFVSRNECVTLDAEKKRYDLHTNTAHDAGYVKFLAEVADVILAAKAPGCSVLDFGSGPNAVLTGILHSRGCTVDSYDPLYGLGGEVMDKRYDCVVLCEVIEHLRNLSHELLCIKNILTKGGKIVVRTQLRPLIEHFGTWWYKSDCTHINFFSRDSLRTAFHLVGLELVESPFPDIFIGVTQTSNLR